MIEQVFFAILLYHYNTGDLEAKGTEICPFLKSLQLYKTLTAKINDQITISPLLTSRGKKQLQHSYLDIHHPTEHIRYPH